MTDNMCSECGLNWNTLSLAEWQKKINEKSDLYFGKMNVVSIQCITKYSLHTQMIC